MSPAQRPGSFIQPPLPLRPRVTLITACFNAEQTILRTLRSVAAQEGDFALEHLIQDGGSTDGTCALIKEYAEKSPHRVLLASGPDGGFYDAINRGLVRATGDVIGLLNADDALADPRVVQDVVQRFADPSAPDLVYADLDYVRPTAEACGPAGSYRVVRRWVAGEGGAAGFRHGWMPPHPTVYVRREVYERWGGYRLDCGTAADYEWLVRIFMKHRVRWAYLPRVTVRMLVGGQSNASILSRLKANRQDRRAWCLNGLTPAPWFSLAKPLRKLGQFLGNITGRG